MVTQSAPEIFHSRDSPFQFEWKERKGWALVGRMTGRLPLVIWAHTRRRETLNSAADNASIVGTKSPVILYVWTRHMSTKIPMPGRASLQLNFPTKTSHGQPSFLADHRRYRLGLQQWRIDWYMTSLFFFSLRRSLTGLLACTVTERASQFNIGHLSLIRVQGISSSGSNVRGYASSPSLYD